MNALICSSFGPPESLTVGELAEPVPSPDQVLIDVHYASLNFPDILMVAGTYQSRPPLPFAPGMEVSGFIRSVGSNVTESAAGDRVQARTGGFGAFAERALAHRNDVLVVPKTLSLE
jgi:NADPH:quinone reductase